MKKYDICGFDKEEELNKIHNNIENNLFYNAKQTNLEDKINLCKITNDKKLKYLDDFINNYEWCVLKDTENKNKYVIFDLQTSDIVESNYTLEQVINRVVCRALDYEINEHYDCFFEYFDCYNHKGYIDYINGLYEIAIKYKNNQEERTIKTDKYEISWLLDIKKSINEMTRYFNEVNK